MSESSVVHVPSLSDEQWVKLERFRELVDTDSHYANFHGIHDYMLLRYLRARNFKVKKASKALLDTLKWRSTFGADSLVLEDVQQAARSGKMYMNGFDRENHPIIYMRTGIDNDSGHDEKVKHVVYVLEEAVDSLNTFNEKNGHCGNILHRRDEYPEDPIPEDLGEPYLDTLTWIIDFHKSETSKSKFSFRDITTGIKLVKILVNHYPERLARIFFVNASSAFHGIFKLARPFLDKVTLEKVVFVPKMDDADMEGTKARWRECFEPFIDPDVLEASYGGKSEFVFDFDQYRMHKSDAE